MENVEKAKRAARRFFRLAEVAAEYGGVWVSAAGGTAKVIANVIANHYNIPTEVARRILNEAGREWGGEGWYAALRNIQPQKCRDWDWNIYDPWEKWDEVPGVDVRLLAIAACE